jgi:hypothetical protein
MVAQIRRRCLLPKTIRGLIWPRQGSRLKQRGLLGLNPFGAEKPGMNAGPSISDDANGWGDVGICFQWVIRLEMGSRSRSH